MASGKSSKKTVKKLSVVLPADLHKKAKRSALLADQSLTGLIIMLLQQYLALTADQPPPSK